MRTNIFNAKLLASILLMSCFLCCGGQPVCTRLVASEEMSVKLVNEPPSVMNCGKKYLLEIKFSGEAERLSCDLVSTVVVLDKIINTEETLLNYDHRATDIVSESFHSVTESESISKIDVGYDDFVLSYELEVSADAKPGRYLIETVYDQVKFDWEQYISGLTTKLFTYEVTCPTE